MSKVVFYHKGGPLHDEGTDVQPAGWFFWTETWADAYGPYETEEIADQKATEYGKQL